LKHIVEFVVLRVGQIDELCFCNVKSVETLERQFRLGVFEIAHCECLHVFVFLEITTLLFGHEEKIIEEETIAFFSSCSSVTLMSLHFDQTPWWTPTKKGDERECVYARERERENSTLTNVFTMRLCEIVGSCQSSDAIANRQHRI
jgi:hypothetical protein